MKDLKALQKQNKVLYSMSRKDIFYQEIKKIRNIRAKTMYESFSIISSISYDPGSYLFSDSEWDIEETVRS